MLYRTMTVRASTVSVPSPCMSRKLRGHEQRFAAVMDGNMDFKSIIEACEKTGIQYAMIEQDNCYDRSPFDELKLSAENLLRAGCTF